MHLEAAEIDRARHDDLRDGVARTGVAEGGVLGGEKAHGDSDYRWRTAEDRMRAYYILAPSSAYRRPVLALATRSAMKRGCAKAATWTSGVQYIVLKLPALR